MCRKTGAREIRRTKGRNEQLSGLLSTWVSQKEHNGRGGGNLFCALGRLAIVFLDGENRFTGGTRLRGQTKWKLFSCFDRQLTLATACLSTRSVRTSAWPSASWWEWRRDQRNTISRDHPTIRIYSQWSVCVFNRYVYHLPLSYIYIFGVQSPNSITSFQFPR